MTKISIREKILSQREKQTLIIKQSRDKKIVQHLIKFQLFRKTKTFFTYLAHRGEVSTDEVIQKFFGEKKIIVPTLSSKKICLHELQNPENFKKGKFGIREPQICLPLHQMNDIDVALVPGIAFDTQGYRIGFGGGYFDRLLKKMHCPTIGLAYEFQIIDKVPTHHYDVPVHYLITEKRIIRCQPSKNKIRRFTKSSRQK